MLAVGSPPAAPAHRPAFAGRSTGSSARCCRPARCLRNTSDLLPLVSPATGVARCGEHVARVVGVGRRRNTPLPGVPSAAMLRRVIAVVSVRRRKTSRTPLMSASIRRVLTGRRPTRLPSREIAALPLQWRVARAGQRAARAAEAERTVAHRLRQRRRCRRAERSSTTPTGTRQKRPSALIGSHRRVSQDTCSSSGGTARHDAGSIAPVWRS